MKRTDTDDFGLREKYLHSRGAALHDEGKYDEAIECFEQAQSLQDEPYTRYHLALSFTEKGDIDRALDQLNRAIELNPSVAKYYHRRSILWRMKSDDGRASMDYEKAILLEPDYARIEEIRSSYEALEGAFVQDETIDWCAAAKPKTPKLRKIVRDLEKNLRRMRAAVHETSCLLPCPAYCCHFSGELVRHGVYIGAWKLLAIRKFLKEKGLSEDAFLTRMPFGGEEHLRRLIPPNFVIRERGEEFVYFPRRRKGLLSEAALRARPKGRGYQELLWINDRSRACSFLQHGRCMIHDLGDDPGLGACKEFLCLTGFVYAALRHLNLVDDSRVQERSMEELNRIGVQALIVVSSTLYRDETLNALGASALSALKRSVGADREGDGEAVAGLIEEYRRSKARYENALAQRIEGARKEMDRLFEVG